MTSLNAGNASMSKSQSLSTLSTNAKTVSRETLNSSTSAQATQSLLLSQRSSSSANTAGKVEDTVSISTQSQASSGAETKVKGIQSRLNSIPANALNVSQIDLIT